MPCKDVGCFYREEALRLLLLRAEVRVQQLEREVEILERGTRKRKRTPQDLVQGYGFAEKEGLS